MNIVQLRVSQSAIDEARALLARCEAGKRSKPKGLVMRTHVAETSIEAFHAHVVTGKASAQQARILSFIAARGGDWSIGELAQALDLEKSTVSARVFELLHGTHELVERPKRKDRISGVTIRPVAIPPEHGALF